MSIPVIDLFAGPGGLGEGFSAYSVKGKRVFRIGLSIEKETNAHKTLRLRAFFRQFSDQEVPVEYYDYLCGSIPFEDLVKKFPAQAQNAENEAWHAELGSFGFPSEWVERRIGGIIGTRVNWVLVGGPPCQAYSIVGRSRRKNDPSFAGDEKHFLYEQYLKIIAVHKPPVFVMENVKGLLSAKVNEDGMFKRIFSDLSNPYQAVFGKVGRDQHLRYRLVPLSIRNEDLLGQYAPEDYVVRAEDHGIPQARHRIILLGIRADNSSEPMQLVRRQSVSIEAVIGDLPRLRSGLSKEVDSVESWCEAIASIKNADWMCDERIGKDLRDRLASLVSSTDKSLTRGGDRISGSTDGPLAHIEWYRDPRMRGVCNHSTRAHIRADIQRYLFASAFAQVNGRSPLLANLPRELLPLHQNIETSLIDRKFNDRFRVQVAGRASTTITSHISKDGHYYIHYDPVQCRSLTVREAARLQTFPDNYFFEGERTAQYRQVGNAVPPLLARQIAEIVYGLMR